MNFRYITRLTAAFLNRFKTVLVASAFLGFVIFLLIRVLAPTLMGRTTERIAVTGRYHTSDLPYSVLSLIGEGLTKIDEQGIPVPALAQNWESIDNGKTWKFILRQDATWQDGTAVSSSNIKYSFEDVSVTTPDEKTIIFQLKDPFAPFPTVVSKPTFKKGLLGSGQWKLDKVILSGSVVEELVLTDLNRNKKILKFYPTDDRSKLAFQLGEVDVIWDILDPKPLDKWKTVEISETVNQKRIVSVFLNLEDELLSEKKVRQALSYAIDKDRFGVRAVSNVFPGSWAYNSQTKPYDFDQKHAKSLLDSADLIKQNPDKAHVKLATTPLLLQTAEEIAKDWEKIGVKTTVQVASTIPDNYQAYLAMYDIPSDPDQYPTWHSTQSETNLTRYQNPRVDKLLEEGRQELDFETRRKIYLDFQRFLLEDAPIIILYHPLSYTINRL